MLDLTEVIFKDEVSCNWENTFFQNLIWSGFYIGVDFSYHALSKLFLSNDLFWVINVVFWLLFELKLVWELNNLLNKAIGVRIKKNINESKTLGIIWLNMYETLNHIFSIITDDLYERTPKPERNKQT